MILATILIAIVATAVQGSLFEWALHRYWLHRPKRPYAFFHYHTLVHHQLCKNEDTFHVTEPKQKEALTFEWWACPALMAINTLPWVGLSFGLGMFGLALPRAALLISVASTLLAYYILYEGMHVLMHVEGLGWAERFLPFKFLKRHHFIHHLHMSRNFNVVVPLADLLFGTLETRVPVQAHNAVTAPQVERRAG